MMAKKGDVTVDEDFVKLETRFNNIVKQVNELREQSATFRDAVGAMLEHQVGCATVVNELYDPMMGVQQTEEGVVKRRPSHVSLNAVEAAQDYATAMTYCQEEILQEMDQLDQCVVQPAENMQTIIKSIQKTIVKRQHKLVDYDRFRTSLLKFKQIADRSPSEDKHVYKLEGQLETATADYEYLNQMLKQDLVQFVHLSSAFIQPVQNAFYDIQCRVVGGMYGRIYEVVDNHRAYFETLDQAIDVGFAWRTRQRNVQHELEQIDILRKGGALNGTLIRPEQATLQERAAAKQAPLPPPPPPKPVMKQFVVALYDLDAQQEGDLSIRSGDKIEVLEKTAGTNDWWKGRAGDREGMFPANYVENL